MALSPAPTLRVEQTPVFTRWFATLRDHKAKAHILTRIDRLGLGHFGDAKPVGGGVSELRLHHGPGYRIYFARLGGRLVLLACGGDKSTQRADIMRARELVAAWEPDNGA